MFIVVLTLVIAAALFLTAGISHTIGYDAGYTDGRAVERGVWVDRAHANAITAVVEERTPPYDWDDEEPVAELLALLREPPGPARDLQRMHTLVTEAMDAVDDLMAAPLASAVVVDELGQRRLERAGRP